jgi:hypothetical protein
MLRRSVALAFVAAACSGGSAPAATGLGPQASGPGPETVVDAAVDAGVDAPDVDASVDAAVDAPPALTIPTDYTPARGKRIVLERDKATAVGFGLKVAIASAGHKHRVDGGAVGFYELTFQRGGKRGSLRISVGDEPVEYELDALGVLLVLTSDGGPIEVTTVGKTPRPLDEGGATDLIQQTATRIGLPLGDASYGIETGVLSYVSSDNGVPRWRARVGLYTRRIWFLPPRPEA